MTEKELKGRLLKGLDVDYQGITIRNYSTGEIFEDLGLDKYEYLISLTILDVKDIFKDNKIDNIDNLKMYDVICTSFEFNNWFIEFLNTFTYMEWSFGNFNDFVAYDENKKRFRITKDKFDGLMDIVKRMYVVNRGEKSNNLEIDPNLAVDEETRKFAEEILELQKENKKRKNGSITMMGIINGICSKPNGYTLLNIWDLTVYQLMAQYYGIEQDENYGYILSSVYSGFYDTKKNKLDINKIHWACEIDV